MAYGAAHACRGELKGQLFSAVARAAERRVADFNAQDLANTAWAFATAGHKDAQLFSALARAAERRVEDFNAQAIANTAKPFGASGGGRAGGLT